MKYRHNVVNVVADRTLSFFKRTVDLRHWYFCKASLRDEKKLTFDLDLSMVKIKVKTAVTFLRQLPLNRECRITV